jgi:hypothetical protein
MLCAKAVPPPDVLAWDSSPGMIGNRKQQSPIRCETVTETSWQQWTQIFEHCSIVRTPPNKLAPKR